MGPKYPLYIPSKGRSEYMMTSKALTKMGVFHYIIVEKADIEPYNKAIKRMGLLAETIELDLKYKDNYELCDNLGFSKSTGPGPARNFAWDHSIKNGFAWHWVMDDNIRDFRVYYKNKRIITQNCDFWAYMEDFVLRYDNIYMAGPNYNMFAFGASKLPAFVSNTRIYSCNFIKNNIPFRWRGRYNEDTILSLDILKAGKCTIQFNMFLQNKIGTQVLKGGNSDEFYLKEGKRENNERYADTGTNAKSEMLARVHPDIAKIKFKFGRVHHIVNYNIFKKMKFIQKKNYKDIVANERSKILFKFSINSV